MSIQEISNEKQLSQIINGKPLYTHIFIDFYATWCGPCKRISPKLEEFSKTYPQVKFIKIDVDKFPSLTDKYNVTAMPTFLVFKVGDNKPLYSPIAGADITKIENIHNKTWSNEME